jgi:hypothetical protein
MMANADVEIGQVNMTMTFEPEAGTAAPAVTQQARQMAADRTRLKELLRPMILEIIGDEIEMHGRMRG